MPDFGHRLAEVLEDRGPLCLGIDPHPFLLREWGVSDSAEGVREFALRVVEAASAGVGIIKPQVAFFERHGAAGYTVLEEVLAAARSFGLMTIIDAKRGDIGTTVNAYAEAWLTPGSPLEADAMTFVAYQGVDSLSAPIAQANTFGKGIFVLAATSNPEAFSLQSATINSGHYAGSTVAAGIVSEISALNAPLKLGNIGVVIGATVRFSDYGITERQLERTAILAPGFGEQGIDLSELKVRYGSVTGNVIANVGRAVLRAGPREIEAAVRSTSAVAWSAL